LRACASRDALLVLEGRPLRLFVFGFFDIDLADTFLNVFLVALKKSSDVSASASECRESSSLPEKVTFILRLFCAEKPVGGREAALEGRRPMRWGRRPSRFATLAPEG
jgi:hypothetical protein